VRTGEAARQKDSRFGAGGFRDWRQVVDGTVAHPLVVSLADLKTLPVRSQITEVACEEGWSYIAEWIGTPLSGDSARGGRAAASALHCVPRFRKELVGQHRHGGCDGSAHFADNWHERRRSTGAKSLKFVTHITAIDDIKKFGKGLGTVDPEYGYAWYAGI
jgi:hypothetical protein